PGSLYFNCRMYGDSCVDGSIVADADAIVECATCPNGVGRRPRGLRNTRQNKASSRVGAYLANAAHLEAASVHAFRILQRDLAAHGAPADLLRGAARAEADEIRHTRATAKLARAHGATPKRARVSRTTLRSLEDIALENAVEGCVRETFGAAFAMWQGEHAQDRAIAAAMRKIARDEARHAALSWAVGHWAESQLDDAARTRIATAKKKALQDLESELGRQTHPELAERAGVPTREKQRVMLRVLAAELRLSA
ncbi:MAG: ferritin-like domain-containing protein, partial [Polyangiaceae bacterium]